jgi:hypothetical protein
MTMPANYTAIRKVAGVVAAPNLSAFSVMVHMISGASHKLFLRLGIGDGAFPKSAKMRQKAPFDGAIHRVENATNETIGDGVKSRIKTVTNEPTSDGSRIKNVINEPTGGGDENRKRDKRTQWPR